MPKVLVIYYSRSGNTEKMAKAVAESAKSIKSVAVNLSYHIEAEELASYDAITRWDTNLSRSDSY
jgi:flavodoxin